MIDARAEALLRSDRLAVEIGAASRIVAGEPLMAVQMEDMRLLARMEIPEHDFVVR